METMPMKRFYTKRYFPQSEGERIEVDGVVVVARLKDVDIERGVDGRMILSKNIKQEGCDRCCFHTRYGCGLNVDNLGCFDFLRDRRYYYEKEADNGEEVERSQEVEGIQGF